MNAAWLLVIIASLLGPPALSGEATFYAEPYLGRAMRNGETYTGDEMTCAVDDSQWQSLQNVQLLVCVDFQQPFSQWKDSGQDYDNPGLYPEQLVSSADEFNHHANYSETPDSSLSHPAFPDSSLPPQKCVVVRVTDTGLLGAGNIDLSVVAFRALRPYGTEWDNNGRLPIVAWRLGAD